MRYWLWETWAITAITLLVIVFNLWGWAWGPYVIRRWFVVVGVDVVGIALQCVLMEKARRRWRRRRHLRRAEFDALLDRWLRDRQNGKGPQS